MIVIENSILCVADGDVTVLARPALLPQSSSPQIKRTEIRERVRKRCSRRKPRRQAVTGENCEIDQGQGAVGPAIRVCACVWLDTTLHVAVRRASLRHFSCIPKTSFQAAASPTLPRYSSREQPRLKSPRTSFKTARDPFIITRLF